MCRKCWWKVEIFHNFYLQIEYIHTTPAQEYENIFVQNLEEFPVETYIKTEGDDAPDVSYSSKRHSSDGLVTVKTKPKKDVLKIKTKASTKVSQKVTTPKPPKPAPNVSNQ